MRLIPLFLIALLGLSSLSSPTVAAPSLPPDAASRSMIIEAGARCGPGAHWVPGHHAPNGAWIPGHCVPNR